MLLRDVEAQTTSAKTNVEIKTALVFSPRKYVPVHHYKLVFLKDS